MRRRDPTRISKRRSQWQIYVYQLPVHETFSPFVTDYPMLSQKTIKPKNYKNLHYPSSKSNISKTSNK
jgi:hypothetical protein